MDKYFAGNMTVVSNEGEKTFSECISPETKVLALYFSKWECAPCQEFTPLLIDVYNEINEENPKMMEVIFLSGDQTQELYDKYMAKMPWIAAPRGDEAVKNAAKAFNVRGVPRLVMLNAQTGETLNDNYLDEVKTEGPVAVERLVM